MNVVEELISQDGPILAFIRDDKNQFCIALAIDRDEELTRWVQSPITETQRQALLLGGLAVRDAIVAPKKVRLVDYKNATDLPVRWWDVEPAEIPESCLPERHAFLPSSIRAQHAGQLASLKGPEWHFAGEGIGDDMPLSKVAAATRTIQRFVTALCEWLELPPLELRTPALRPGGSMVLEIRGLDSESLSRFVKEYQSLALATYDKEELHRALARSSKKVADSYADYLKFVDLNKVEILAEWPAGSAYLGHNGAKQARPEVESVKLELAAEVQTSLLTLRGYFEGFTVRSGRFEFYDLADAQTYVGRVAQLLRAQIALDEKFEMTLGKETQKYDVTIEIAQKATSARLSYTLIDYREVPEEPLLPKIE